MKRQLSVLLCISALLTTLTQAREVSIESKVQGLYIGYFKRAADKDGLDFWLNRANQSNNSNTILKELSAGFATHPTFISTYSGLGNRAFVEAIYRNILSRDGDSGGIDFWTQRLESGQSRSDMVSDFVDLSLTGDLTTLNLSAEELTAAQLRQDLITNKVAVAKNFTNVLAQYTKIQDIAHPENDPAYLASINILSSVTENTSTVSVQTNYLSCIATESNPIGEINTAIQKIDGFKISCESIFTLQ